MIQLVLAHGIGGRSDLPIPVSLAQYGAVAVLVLTFVLLSRAWKTARFESPSGLTVRSIGRLVDSRITAIALRALGFAALAAVVVFGVFGNDNPSLNPLPTWIYVWLWVGLVPASIVLGPIWQRIDPLPAISRALSGGRVPRPLPASVGLWPAAIGLLAFGWLELVAPERDLPRVVATVVIVYSIVQVVCGVVFGSGWFDRAGIFTTYSNCFARLSPWARDPNGALSLVDPLRNLAATRPQPGSFAVVAVMLGTTAFDGFTRSSAWNDFTNGNSEATVVIAATFALVLVVTLVAGSFALAVSAMNAGVSSSDLAHSLIPIAAGYSIAHYFSLFVFQGQAGFLLAFDTGAGIDYGVVSTTVISVVQVAAIIVGHVVGVASAHDRALVFGATARSQLPMITMMVVYTFTGIGLLLGA